ncbi:hypothetical protein [Hansschlegelia plantiphila]|nr:hypothetical protein [Hansschlegelia plantiphila]
MMDEADAFMAEVEAIVARAPELSPLHAAVIAALDQGVASDSRTFAKVFGVAHALTLRAISDLSDGFGLIEETARDPRTQRARLALTEAGRRLVPHPAPIAA